MLRLFKKKKKKSGFIRSLDNVKFGWNGRQETKKIVDKKQKKIVVQEGV
jgi:hypothetical protein